MRRQLEPFLTFAIIAVCICNPDRSPVGINRLDAAPTPTGFGEIVSALMAASMLP
jgi:hypothetical protein